MKKSSRKEAPLSDWKKLYDLATRFMKKKPWEILMNEEYICIRFSEDDEAFFTIMGNGGLEYGFGMYIGEAAFCEMLLQIRYAHEPVTDEYIMFMQNCLVMFQDKKSDIPEEQLDVRKYGVIVSRGSRRGLLLPDLDGVDTVKQQVDIAMRKGGISRSDRYKLQRFEVIRHY